jgi:hypothetical protein
MTEPIEDFVAHPTTFLNNNLITADLTLPLQPERSEEKGNVWLFLFEPRPPAMKLQTGAAIPCYRLKPVTEPADRKWVKRNGARDVDYLAAYWCNYGQDEQFRIMVAGAANFMFTTTMDGCTFGIGSATATGARLVSHINMSWEGAQAHTAQRGVLRHQGMAQHIVDPDRYMRTQHVPQALPGQIKATTVGVRDAAGHWTFRYQQYYRPGAEFAASTFVLVRLRRV